MQTVLSPLVNVYQTQLEASRRFADAIFSGTEKIDRVVIESIHRVFNQQLTLAQTMASIRDPQSAASTLQSNLLARNPEYTMNYQKEIMQIFADMQNELGRSLQAYIEQLGTNAASGAAAPLENARQQANDAVYNPMTSMFSVWESAFREAAALAKKNMMTARSTMEDATSRTMDRATAFATTAAGSGMENAATHASRAADAAEAAGSSALGSDAEPGGERRGGPSSGKRKH